MSTHRINYEKASDGSWSASAVDLPVYAAGETREEAEREIREAIRLYLDEPDAERKPAATAPRPIRGTVAA